MPTDKCCVATYTATGILTCHWAWACVVLGLGSALFHIAAGTSTLKQPRPGTSVDVFESQRGANRALFRSMTPITAPSDSSGARIGALNRFSARFAPRGPRSPVQRSFPRYRPHSRQGLCGDRGSYSLH